MLYLAIDQHRKQLTVNLRNEDGNVLLKRQVSTDWKAVIGFFEQLNEQSRAEGGYVAIVEVCGFNDWLLELLPKHGCREVLLVQPKKRSRKKTDRRDAQQLGELLWVNRERLLRRQSVQGLRRVRIGSPRDQESSRLTARRQRMGRQRTRTINQVHHLLRRHNLEQHCPTKGIQTKQARTWLERLKLNKLDRFELDQLLAQWKLWDQQIDELDDRIHKRALRDPRVELLLTMFGCQAFSALSLVCRVGDVRRFPRPRSLANYWGLTPKCHNSGEVTDRLGSITKEGSGHARFVLGQMTLHVLRKDPLMRDWYKRIKRRRGSKIARVAVMRRLATIIWHMLTYNERYTVGGPQPRAAAAEAVAA